MVTLKLAMKCQSTLKITEKLAIGNHNQLPYSTDLRYLYTCLNLKKNFFFTIIN